MCRNACQVNRTPQVNTHTGPSTHHDTQLTPPPSHQKHLPPHTHPATSPHQHHSSPYPIGTPKRCAEPKTMSAPHSPGGVSLVRASRSVATHTLTPAAWAASTMPCGDQCVHTRAHTASKQPRAQHSTAQRSSGYETLSGTCDRDIGLRLLSKAAAQSHNPPNNRAWTPAAQASTPAEPHTHVTIIQ